MKKLLKVILWLPKMILLLLWRIIWSFIQTVVIIAIVILGLIYYSNHSDSKFAHDISNLSDRIVTIYDHFNQKESKSKAEKISPILSDQLGYSEGIKWQDNQANVYIETTNPVFVNAYRAAINNWNNTGTFQFKIVNDPSAAAIIAKETNDQTMDAAGLAKVESETLTKTITNAKVYLNAYYLLDHSYGYNAERIVHTAEHELGHAIGLEHDEQNHSVMKSSGSYYGIQESDMVKVRAIYQ